MSQTPVDDPLIQELRGADSATVPTSTRNIGLEDEKLQHYRQRRFHKAVLLWGALGGCIVLFSFFCYVMLFSDLPLRYLEKSVFSLIPLTLMGVAPLILLVSLFRCVFRPSGNTDLIDKKDLVEVVKDVASIIKALH